MKQTKQNNMRSKDLIKSFMKQAKWGQNADDGRPWRGVKWLSVKQKQFLWSLCEKEDPEGVDFFTQRTWSVDGYKASMGKIAPNGCVAMTFINLKGE